MSLLQAVCRGQRGLSGLSAPRGSGRGVGLLPGSRGDPSDPGKVGEILEALVRMSQDSGKDEEDTGHKCGLRKGKFCGNILLVWRHATPITKSR